MPVSGWFANCGCTPRLVRHRAPAISEQHYRADLLALLFEGRQFRRYDRQFILKRGDLFFCGGELCRERLRGVAGMQRDGF